MPSRVTRPPPLRRRPSKLLTQAEQNQLNRVNALARQWSSLKQRPKRRAEAARGGSPISPKNAEKAKAIYKTLCSDLHSPLPHVFVSGLGTRVVQFQLESMSSLTTESRDGAAEVAVEQWNKRFEKVAVMGKISENAWVQAYADLAEQRGDHAASVELDFISAYLETRRSEALTTADAERIHKVFEALDLT